MNPARQEGGLTDPNEGRIAFGGEALGVIPARCASRRFPDKPLALIGGVPMVCWTWKRASQARSLKRVFVATEDRAIVAAVEKWGGEARLVQGFFRSGSDRVACAVRGSEAPAVVNIQADEPLLDPRIIDRALAMLEARTEFDLTTAVRPIYRREDYLNPNCVKVVLDARLRCLYFSRAPIPAWHQRPSAAELPAEIPFRQHIGLYCFRPEVLKRFAQLPASALEKCEGLEQLRLLEAGMTIGAVETHTFTPGVDTPEDLQLAEQYIADHGVNFA